LNQNKQETFVVGVSSPTMELIIKFAYLRDVSGVTEANVVEMLMVTDYFGMLGLLKYCIDYIIRSLSPENCVIMWLMSR
jgi:kelch-like protein 10